MPASSVIPPSVSPSPPHGAAIPPVNIEMSVQPLMPNAVVSMPHFLAGVQQPTRVIPITIMLQLGSVGTGGTHSLPTLEPQLTVLGSMQHGGGGVNPASIAISADAGTEHKPLPHWTGIGRPPVIIPASRAPRKSSARLSFARDRSQSAILFPRSTAYRSTRSLLGANASHVKRLAPPSSGARAGGVRKQQNVHR